MSQLFIAAIFLAVAGVVAVFYRPRPRGVQISADSARKSAETAPFSVFIVAAFMVILAVITAVLAPVVVVFGGEKMAALIAIMFFFALPALAYGFLRRFNYLDGSETKR